MLDRRIIICTVPCLRGHPGHSSKVFGCLGVAGITRKYRYGLQERERERKRDQKLRNSVKVEHSRQLAGEWCTARGSRRALEVKKERW